LNAAAGLIAGGAAKDFIDGFRLAEKTLDSGAALQALEGLVIKTNQR
jgi:anthranilate phosphoribosyltransferase